MKRNIHERIAKINRKLTNHCLSSSAITMIVINIGGWKRGNTVGYNYKNIES